MRWSSVICQVVCACVCVCVCDLADVASCLCVQNYIARFGHGSAKLARQAKSKEKTLRRMVEGGLTARVATDKVGGIICVFIFICLSFLSISVQFQ